VSEQKIHLSNVQNILKKCFKLMALNQLIEGDYNRILKNKCIKVGIDINKTINDESQLDILEIQENETEKKVSNKYNVVATYEVTKTLYQMKRLFNKVSLEYSIRYLATEQQKPYLNKLLQVVNKPLYVDKLFNINAKLDLFLNGINTEKCLKVEC